MTKIDRLQYRNKHGDVVVDEKGLLAFFQTLFDYFESNNLQPENYCNDDSSVFVLFQGQGIDGYINVGDFIVAAYWSMSEWHDGCDGYVLLSLLGQHFDPGFTTPLSEGSEAAYLMKMFDAHFEDGGEV